MTTVATKLGSPTKAYIHESDCAWHKIWGCGNCAITPRTCVAPATRFLRYCDCFPVLHLFSQGGVTDAERTKKRRRGDRYSVQTSLIVAALKKMLPIGLNMCSPADQELINVAKIRYSLVVFFPSLNECNSVFWFKSCGIL